MPPAGTPQGAIETCSKSASRMIQDALPCVQNLGVDDTKKKSWWPSSQSALFRFQNMQCSAESGPEPEWKKPLGTNSQMKPKLHVAVPKADKWVIPLAASHNYLGKLNIIECLSIYFPVLRQKRRQQEARYATGAKVSQAVVRIRGMITELCKWESDNPQNLIAFSGNGIPSCWIWSQAEQQQKWMSQQWMQQATGGVVPQARCVEEPWWIHGESPTKLRRLRQGGAVRGMGATADAWGTQWNAAWIGHGIVFPPRYQAQLQQQQPQQSDAWQ